MTLRKSRCSWIHNHASWTAAEEDFLRAHRGTMTAAAMAAALPGRTKEAVQSRCNQLGIHKRDLLPEKPEGRMSDRYWTRAEVLVLRMHHLRGPTWIHKWHLPNRSPDAIQMAIKRVVRMPMRRAPATSDLQVAA